MLVQDNLDKIKLLLISGGEGGERSCRIVFTEYRWLVDNKTRRLH